MPDRAVLTPLLDRGRVLQVTVDGHDAFWTNPAATGWNAGGDRLWLGPEWAWYWTDLTSYDPATHEVPPAVDPGTWAVDGDAATQDVPLRHRHGGADVRARVTRTVTVLDPRAYGADAAYATTATLELTEPPPDAAVSLWTLLSVPLGGEAVVPRAPTPRDYFDPAPEGSWRHDGHVLRVTYGGDRIFKLGLAPAAGLDRYAYVRPVGDGRSLVVARTVRTEPGARYADVPLSALDAPGDAVQLFCDGGRLGSFGEVEHHAPAATAERPRVTDESVVTVTLTEDLDEWCAAWDRH